MLKLFYAVGTCALASHIALEEAGAEYEAIRINFGTEEQRKPEYLKINPKARVPALVTDKGILTETPAILAYIAQVFPKARLAPLDDPFAFARAQAFNSYLCSTAHVNHAHLARGYRWADEPSSIEDMKRRVPKNVGESFALMEKEMVEGPWVMGATYTICDPYLFTVAGWLPRDSVDIARFPKIHEHHKRMAERPAVRRALAEQAKT
jgi:glutathione S-transferase